MWWSKKYTVCFPVCPTSGHFTVLLLTFVFSPPASFSQLCDSLLSPPSLPLSLLPSLHPSLPPLGKQDSWTVSLKPPCGQTPEQFWAPSRPKPVVPVNLRVYTLNQFLLLWLHHLRHVVSVCSFNCYIHPCFTLLLLDFIYCWCSCDP